MVMLYGNTSVDSRGIVTNPSTANYIQSGVVVNPKTLQANPVLSPYGYAGAAPFGALQGAVNSLVSGLMSPRPAAPRPTQTQMPLQGGVSTARPVTAATTYNQPYAPVTNVRNTSVNIPDLFKSTPMIPPSSMDFQSLSPMPAAQAARISTGAGSAPLPAAVSMGVQSLPMMPAAAQVNTAWGFGGPKMSVKDWGWDESPQYNPPTPAPSPTVLAAAQRGLLSDAPTVAPPAPQIQGMRPTYGAMPLFPPQSPPPPPVVINQAPARPAPKPLPVAQSNTFYQQSGGSKVYSGRGSLTPLQRVLLGTAGQLDSGWNDVWKPSDNPPLITLDMQNKPDRRVPEPAEPPPSVLGDAPRVAPALRAKDGGLLEQGNIDLARRPIVRNADGSISTVRSMSFNDGTSEVLIPTVSDDGRIMSEDEAIQNYMATGKHLGKFATPEAATRYAEQLHNQQDQMYTPQAQAMQTQPMMNPYAQPTPPMPPSPMVTPRYRPGQYMPNLQPPQQLYQPPAPQRTDFMGRVGRAMQRMGEGLNPNIAAANIARAKADADIRMKMLEMDSQNWREAAGNTTAMMREMMQQGGLDRREQFSQDSQNYRAQLQAQAQGKLSQAQGYELLGEALGMVPQNEADYALKAQRLAGASQVFGRDFSGLLSQTSTAGSNAALKQAMEFKRDAMAMLKQQNDLEMQPIENDIKRLQKQNAQNQAEMAPVEAATKMANLQKTSLEAAQLRDPELQAAKRAEALAKSQDIQRRAGEDQFAAIQKRAQMGATMIGQANQMLANPLAMFDPATKKQANQLIQQGQALQQEAFVSYQRPLLKPAKPGIALSDMGIVEGYKMINGGDLAKAKAMAKADGWILPELGSPKVGMK